MEQRRVECIRVEKSRIIYIRVEWSKQVEQKIQYIRVELSIKEEGNIKGNKRENRVEWSIKGRIVHSKIEYI